MKTISSKALSLAIPRQGSLQHRLQVLPVRKGDAERPLDQLMIFLDDPPGNIRDRWKAGVKMCAQWGITTTRSSIWRLYRSLVLEWRLRLAHQADSGANDPSRSLLQRAERMIAARTVELLANPQLTPGEFVGLVRAEHQRQALELSQQKYADEKVETIKLALDALAKEIGKSPEARATFKRLREIMSSEK